MPFKTMSLKTLHWLLQDPTQSKERIRLECLSDRTARPEFHKYTELKGLQAWATTIELIEIFLTITKLWTRLPHSEALCLEAPVAQICRLTPSTNPPPAIDTNLMTFQAIWLALRICSCISYQCHKVPRPRIETVVTTWGRRMQPSRFSTIPLTSNKKLTKRRRMMKLQAKMLSMDLVKLRKLWRLKIKAVIDFRHSNRGDRITSQIMNIHLRF